MAVTNVWSNQQLFDAISAEAPEAPAPVQLTRTLSQGRRMRNSISNPLSRNTSVAFGEMPQQRKQGLALGRNKTIDVPGRFPPASQMITSKDKQDTPAMKFNPDLSGLGEIVRICALCSRAEVDKSDPESPMNIKGDATEIGLLRFALQHINDLDQLHKERPKVFEIPFKSDTKWHLTVHRSKHAFGELELFIKGAPERILRLCTHILLDKKLVPKTQAHEDAFNAMYKLMAGKGHRVLAFAYLPLPSTQFPVDFEFKKDPFNFPMVRPRLEHLSRGDRISCALSG